MSHETPAPPRLADLLARHLTRQAEAHAAGAAPLDGEVTPYEAGPVQPIDPKLAWDEARGMLSDFGTEAKATAAPPHWSALVAAHEPVVALAFGVGSFPQMVRDFHLLRPGGDLTRLRPVPGRPVECPLLLDWANEQAHKGRFPQALYALGALRLAKQFDIAENYLREHSSRVPETWRAAWENERAALAWHAGHAEHACTLWQAQADSVPVWFNRGMANLFLGRTDAARLALGQAVAHLPEASGWYHLGRLYLTLAGVEE